LSEPGSAFVRIIGKVLLTIDVQAGGGGVRQSRYFLGNR